MPRSQEGGTARASEPEGHAEAARKRSVATQCIRGRGRGDSPTASPFSVCADRAALPGLRRERATTSHAVRRSEPLAGAEERRYQVRWCLLHLTPPGIEWAHDGARY